MTCGDSDCWVFEWGDRNRPESVSVFRWMEDTYRRGDVELLILIQRRYCAQLGGRDVSPVGPVYLTLSCVSVSAGVVLAAPVRLLPALHWSALLAHQRELPGEGRPGQQRRRAGLPESLRLHPLRLSGTSEPCFTLYVGSRNQQALYWWGRTALRSPKRWGEGSM